MQTYCIVRSTLHSRFTIIYIFTNTILCDVFVYNAIFDECKIYSVDRTVSAC